MNEEDDDNLFIIVDTENESQTSVSPAQEKKSPDPNEFRAQQIVEDALNLFNEMDKDKSGTITHDEVESFTEKAKLLLFKAYGETEVKHFLSSICQEGKPCSKDEFVTSFIKLAESGYKEEYLEEVKSIAPQGSSLFMVHFRGLLLRYGEKYRDKPTGDDYTQYHDDNTQYYDDNTQYYDQPLNQAYQQGYGSGSGSGLVYDQNGQSYYPYYYYYYAPLYNQLYNQPNQTVYQQNSNYYTNAYTTKFNTNSNVR